MLIFATQDTHQKAIVGIGAANILYCTHVRLSHRITCQPKFWIYLTAHSDHERQRQIKLPARRQNCLTEQLALNAVFRELESIGEGHGHIHRTHALMPVCKKSAYLGDRSAACLGVHGVALLNQALPMFRPAPKDSIQAQRRQELRAPVPDVHPDSLFFSVERIVGHHH